MNGPNLSGNCAKRVVLHVGPFKTGSSTIQRTLLQNVRCLSGAVAIIPRKRATREWRRLVIRAVAVGSPVNSPGMVEAAREVCEAVMALPEPAVVISDENLVGKTPAAGGRTISDVLRETVDVVADAFGATDWRVVIYLRETEAWLRSRHNQDVKLRGCRQTYDEWRACLPGTLEYGPAVEALARRHGERIVAVRMEEEARLGRFLGEAVLRAAGCDAETLDRIRPAIRQNESLRPRQLELTRRVNALPLPRSLQRGVAAIARNMAKS